MAGEGLRGPRDGEEWDPWPATVDRALAAALALPSRAGVYVGPWWDLESTGPPNPPRGWKRAILRRRPGGGAEHWGHLFLVVSSDPGDTGIDVATLPLFKDSRSAARTRRTFRLPTRPGVAWLIARPSTPLGEAPLGELAREIAEALGGTEEK
jgi:hypothetical protein